MLKQLWVKILSHNLYEWRNIESIMVHIKINVIILIKFN